VEVDAEVVAAAVLVEVDIVAGAAASAVEEHQGHGNNN
jgi:hypothetical protein